jgi:hypothetical protein
MSADEFYGYCAAGIQDATIQGLDLAIAANVGKAFRTNKTSDYQRYFSLMSADHEIQPFWRFGKRSFLPSTDFPSRSSGSPWAVGGLSKR